MMRVAKTWSVAYSRVGDTSLLMDRMRPLGVAAILAAAVTLQPGCADARAGVKTQRLAVGAQYGTTHVYVAAEDMDRFAASFLATFGGTSSKPAVVTVTPTPSTTNWQALTTPVGLVSLFGFKTPIPYPFGLERTGYLVTDMDAAVDAARKAGAAVLVAPFPDAIGRDAVVQWPGGVNMQLYWHTKAPSYPPLQTVPENRVYVAPEAAAKFIRGFVEFAQGRIVSDNPRAPGAEIGRPGDIYRRVRIYSMFGKITVLVSDGHLPYPFGRETMGYEVADVGATLTKAKASGASVLVDAFKTDEREAAVVQFPGGYIAEIHSSAR
jgi:predicted enzyme related to lactoylglutathione lyase